MSKHIARQSIKHSFSQIAVSSFLLKREQERFEIYSRAQFIALEEGDLEEVAKIEEKIKRLILE